MENITQKEHNPLGYAPIGKLLMQFALPSVVAMVINAIYNIVDQIFIGQGVGYLGNAATTKMCIRDRLEIPKYTKEEFEKNKPSLALANMFYENSVQYSYDNYMICLLYTSKKGGNTPLSFDGKIQV